MKRLLMLTPPLAAENRGTLLGSGCLAAVSHETRLFYSRVGRHFGLLFRE